MALSSSSLWQLPASTQASATREMKYVIIGWAMEFGLKMLIYEPFEQLKDTTDALIAKFLGHTGWRGAWWALFTGALERHVTTAHQM